MITTIAFLIAFVALLDIVVSFGLFVFNAYAFGKFVTIPYQVTECILEDDIEQFKVNSMDNLSVMLLFGSAGFIIYGVEHYLLNWLFI